MREPYRRHAQDADEPIWQCFDPGPDRRLQSHYAVPLPSCGSTAIRKQGVTRIDSRRRPAEARQLQQRRQFQQRRAGDDAANQRQQHAQEHHRTDRPLRPALLMAERPHAIGDAGHAE